MCPGADVLVVKWATQLAASIDDPLRVLTLVAPGLLFVLCPPGFVAAYTISSLTSFLLTFLSLVKQKSTITFQTLSRSCMAI